MSDSDVKVQITGLKKDIENVTNLNIRILYQNFHVYCDEIGFDRTKMKRENQLRH